MRIAVLIALVLPLTLSALASAQPATPAARPAARPAQQPAARPGSPKPPTSAAEALTVDVRSRAVRPGEVLDIRVQTAERLTSVAVTLGDRPLHAWKLPSGGWRVLAGLDAEQVPGPLVLTVLGARASGAPIAKVLNLTVAAANFADRRLTVPPKFVDPPESERPRIERERQRLQAIYDGHSDLAPGVFVAPVPHRRSSPFGSRSIFNGVPRERHGGMDFASPAGAIIRAPAAGRVVVVGPLYWTGNTVVIDHGQGLYSILAHMTRTLVREGDTVASGARLGTVGATGRVTGPHLHWSVRLGGTRVDPAAVLAVLGPRRP
ncbi:MAG: M23 family metallopeptidase [Vicinamibacteraceae bacterium]